MTTYCTLCRIKVHGTVVSGLSTLGRVQVLIDTEWLPLLTRPKLTVTCHCVALNALGQYVIHAVSVDGCLFSGTIAPAQLLKQDVTEVLRSSEVIVVSQKCVSLESLKESARPDHIVIDVNGWRELEALPWQYEGICW